MMAYEFSIQDVVHDALTGNAALMALVKGVHDAVPQAVDSGDGAAYPYVTLGEDTAQEWDTDTSVGADLTITLHVWSRYRGRKEVKQIQGAIYNVLHRATLVIAGHHLVGIDWIQSDSFLDADGLTRHGVQTFRITVEEQ